MRVDPHRVVELAGRCDEAVQRLVIEWTEASVGLRAACDHLGEGTAVSGVAQAYAEALDSADQVVWGLAHALEGGVAALIDSARDVSQADEAVAFEIDRATVGRGRHRGWDRPAHPGAGHGG